MNKASFVLLFTFFVCIFSNDYLDVSNILESHTSQLPPDTKNFDGQALAYVTPWNRRGYEIAKTFNHKFTLVSPVWYQIRPSLELKGQHDIDKDWVEQVRNTGIETKPKIVPRFLFEDWQSTDFQNVFVRRKDELVKLLVSECEQQGWDGVVLDMGYFPFSLAPYRTDLVAFFQKLNEALKLNAQKLILVIPAARGSGQQLFGAREFQQYAPHVDYFSLMTYDFSGSTPGPNAPLSWILHNIMTLVSSKKALAKQLLVGLNLYGYEYLIPKAEKNVRRLKETRKSKPSYRPIVGHEYLDTLKDLQARSQQAVAKWDSTVHEHILTLSDHDQNHIIYYPTQQSISVRLAKIAEFGVGVSLWEIGQGLNLFYDLF